ncbi:trans-aconitate methyltransferase 1 [Dimargaris verticillata]|uniref:Trans-aconitate methyltransferase 1 n=1 Tax=Dimargaris verticillata TaxID=2761393 RepID=A0A9W8EF50_9FUNG|nr:trans-aconitate methyltransferase 1 [Dimargaris verticillata]
MATFSDPTFNAGLYESHRPRYFSNVAEQILAYHATHQPPTEQPDATLTSSTAEPRSSKRLGLAVDLATGTGQLCKVLGPQFDHVYGLDISPTMISAAEPLPNVSYHLGSAEGDNPAWPDSIAPHSVDVVTVAEAAHWFDRPRAWSYIKHMLKPHGTLAVISYSMPLLLDKPKAAQLLTALISGDDMLAPFWEPGRYEIETLYGHWDIPFGDLQRHYWPHSLLPPSSDTAIADAAGAKNDVGKGNGNTETLDAEQLHRFWESQTGNGVHLPAPQPFMGALMSPTQFVAYMQTWSGYKRYIQAHPDRHAIIHNQVERMMAAEGCQDWDAPWPISFNHALILGTNDVPEVPPRPTE